MRVDFNIVRMAQSVTQAGVETREGDKSYQLIATNVYAEPLINAVQGMAGDRYESHKVDGDKIIFTIRYEDETTEHYHYDTAPAHTEAGEKFCKEITWALQFIGTTENAQRLARFVGGGELELPEEGKAKFTFHDQIVGTFKDVTEGDFVLYTNHGFLVIPEKDFKETWLPLH